MKIIHVMFDSLNRHYLPPYGCDWVHAPNFQRLADRAVTFDRCYVGSMPCVPARRELHTGRYNFLHRSWGPLEPFDDSMPEILKKSGVHTHLVTDHQHYWEDGGATYHNRYSTYDFVRGQEGDLWKAEVGESEPSPVGRLHKQDAINRRYAKEPGSHPQEVTFRRGLEFLETNRKKDNWLLQIETFDPHEPFASRDRFHELYSHGGDTPSWDWPYYRQVTETPEKVEECRRAYAALVSMCDESLGKVLDFMDEHDLWEDTLLLVNTDHGFLLGEHGWWAKCVMPFYEEVAHPPMFLWDPRTGRQGERCDALVQMIDVAPTFLEVFGQPAPKDVQGRSLASALEEGKSFREAALFGMHAAHVNCTDGRYVYMRAPDQSYQAFDYTLMPTRMRNFIEQDKLRQAELAPPFSFTKGCPVLKVPARTQLPGGEPVAPAKTLLFDLKTDPHQEHPIVNPAVEARMLQLMKRLMRETDAPPEVYQRYLPHEE
ncbi:MAG: sulfatase [Opitutales bacterium]